MADGSGLLDALMAFQSDAPKLREDAENPHFHSKYISLEAIVKTVGPKLREHGLLWTAWPTIDSDGRGQPVLRYKLTHVKSGQSEEGEMPLLLQKQDSQGLGSAITYARRYALCSVLNLVADEDDDGHAASSPPAPQRNVATSDYSLDGVDGEALDRLQRMMGNPPTPKQLTELKRRTSGWSNEQKEALAAQVGAASARGMDKAHVSLAIDAIAAGRVKSEQHASDVPNDGDLPWSEGQNATATA